MIINGKLMDGISFKIADKAVNEIIEDLQKIAVPDPEIEKVRQV